MLAESLKTSAGRSTVLCRSEYRRSLTCEPVGPRGTTLLGPRRPLLLLLLLLLLTVRNLADVSRLRLT